MRTMEVGEGKTSTKSKKKQGGGYVTPEKLFPSKIIKLPKNSSTIEKESTAVLEKHLCEFV